MFLQRLQLTNFKNIPAAKLSFSSRIVSFTGRNGAGKTNLLDAIHYLSTGKSYFNYIDSQNIRNGESFFAVNGQVALQEEQFRVNVGLVQGRRKALKVNDVPVKRLAEHYGRFPVVMITPYDTSIILGGSEERRRFIDSIISLKDSQYMELLMRWDKVMQQRNALLKEADEHPPDPALLGIYNEQLTELAAPIHQARVAFIRDFNPVFQRYVNEISGRNDVVALNYQSQLNDQPMVELLERRQEKDRILGRTTGGIHRDDLEFLIHEQPMKKFGSQGQQKTFLLALKLAEFDWVKAQKGFPPLLLLDDLFDRLDQERVQQLLQLLQKMETGQVFITDTSAERVQEATQPLESSLQLFHIRQGEVEEVV